jgi:hypothetical protein
MFACRSASVERLVLQVELLIPDGPTPCGYTRLGRRRLAREWRLELDWEMKEPKEPKPSLGQMALR